MTRTMFSNATLRQQIASIPQVVNNGPDGKGRVVRADGEAKTHHTPAAVSTTRSTPGPPS